jgi:hypothetical protein
VHVAGSLEDIGLAGAKTPLSVLIDSTSKILLATGDAASANAHPMALLELSQLLRSCS